MLVVPRLIRKLGTCGFDFPPYIYSKMHKNFANSALLTFDDGPHEKGTQEILDLLNKYGIKSAFFCVGKYLEKYYKIAELIVNEGHSLQNHSYSHMSFGNINQRIAENEIRRCRTLIDHLGGGSQIRLFRPPEGLVSIRNLMKVRECEETLMLWNWFYKNIELRKSILPNRGGMILLHHDWSPTVIKDTERVIRHLVSKSYKFIDLGKDLLD